jgi:hypothetical protein
MLNRIALSREEIDRLEAAKKRELRGSIFNLRIDLQENGLVLFGKARSYYAKQLAQSYVMDSAGLDLASNQIIVGVLNSN